MQDPKNPDKQRATDDESDDPEVLGYEREVSNPAEDPDPEAAKKDSEDDDFDDDLDDDLDDEPA